MVWHRHAALSQTKFFAVLMVAIIALTCVFLVRYLFGFYQNGMAMFYDPLVLMYSFIWIIFFVSRLLLERKYRPVEDNGYRPTVTVVVPVKNEEKLIENTLERILTCDYPQDKLEVLTVNDGSTDNTLQHMLKVKARYPKLQIIDFSVNKGKRIAMATAIKVAKGEIIVSVDSDTFIDRDTIYNLVVPFKDDRVNGVCGHTDASNSSNWLSRAQLSIYYMGFRVFKAAEHVLGFVTCLSGCLSAFRRSAVLQVLDEWVDQSKRYFSGEDRALTTLLLRDGGKLMFQDSARAKTVVPERFKTYIKQQLRWKRSYFTENFRTSLFIWRKPILMLYIVALLFLSLLAPIIIFREFFIIPFLTGSLIRPLLFVFGLCCIGIFYGAYQILLGGHGFRVVGDSVVCFLLYIVLIWQTPWALLTLNDSRWLTRN